LMRWQLAYPGHVIFNSPLFGKILLHIFGPKFVGPDVTTQTPGVMSSELYNMFGAMHGTIMVFFGIVPIAFAAFGNFVVPLQIGAPDMTFPKINMMSFWSFFLSGIIMLSSFLIPGGAAKSGWTSYSPLANITDQPLAGVDPTYHSVFVDFLRHHPTWALWLTGQTLWIIGMVFNITGSLLGSVNFITTILQLRAPGLTWMRLPFFVWAQLVTSFLLLLAFPPLEAASIFQLMDRVAGTSFFLPTGLVVQDQVVNISGGGSPLLWQHLFWFLAHPEVYVLILPGIGIIAEVVANNTRKPLWGYKAMVFAILVLGFLSFIVWAHHMYMTGMGATVSAFFQTTTIMISVPSVILLTALILSLWGGAIRFTVPMMFALAFMPMFGIGGLTGIPLAFNALDLYLHDTYYIIGHFHYIVAPGTIFAIFAGVYYWYPKATGRMLNEFWGKVHFWTSLIFINGIFFPMFLQGMIGMHRRWYDGGDSYEISKNIALGLSGIQWNVVMSWAAWMLGISQIPFIINFFYSIRNGRKIGRNPWDATTLEWQAPSPPPHGNFDVPIVVHRGPYEYSVPGASADFLPQTTPTSATAPAAPELAH
jgi:cytochrome c oxidase subunit 1